MGNYIHYISPFFNYTIIYMYTVTHTSIKACYFFKEGNEGFPGFSSRLFKRFFIAQFLKLFHCIQIVFLN